MLAAANRAVLLIENWTEHDYGKYCDDHGLDYEWVEDFGTKGLLIRTQPAHS
jgi:hypothetical protein